MRKISFLLIAALLFVNTIVYADTFNYTPQNRVRVIGEAENNQAVTMMLIKKGVKNITPSDIGYIAQVQTDENNKYNFDFVFKEDINEYNVMVRQGNKVISDTVDIAESKLEAVDAKISVNNHISGEISVTDITAQMKNFFFDNLQYQIFLAFYDETQKLIAVKKVEEGILADGETSSSHSEQIPVGTDTVKGFVMSSDYEPLGIAQETKTDIIKQYYVSTTGQDSNDGSENAPVATLEKASELAALYAADNNITKGTIAIVLEEGTYKTTNGTRISDFKFGETKLEIYAKDGDIVKLTNADEIDINDFKKVTDTEILNRLPDNSIDLYVIDLSEEITEYGNLEIKDGNTTIDRKLDFYFNGEPLTIARYPNEGYLTIADEDVKVGSNYQEDGTGDTAAIFTSGAHKERIKKWIGVDDLRIYGFFC